MFRAMVQNHLSPNQSPKMPKPIKTYGRRRISRLSAHENSPFFFKEEEMEEMDGVYDQDVPFEENETKDLDDDRDLRTLLEWPVLSEQITKAHPGTAANSKAKRQPSKQLRARSRVRTRFQGPQANADVKVKEKRRKLLAKRRAEYEAIQENDRAEEEFERERNKLYRELEEAKENGWIEQEGNPFLQCGQRPVREASQKSWRERDEEAKRVKRCKRDVEALDEAIYKLRVARERVWWSFYNSIEGLSLAEKQEMRKIKRATWKNPDHNGGMIGGMPYTKPSAAEVFGCQSSNGCLYCDDDECEGC